MGIGVVAQRARDVHAARPRHLPVQQQQRRALRARQAQGHLAIARRHDPEAVGLQAEGQQLHDGGIVIGDEDRLRSRAPRHRCGRARRTGLRGLPLGQLQHLALGPGQHLEHAPTGGGPPSADFHQSVDRVVVPQGVVVKEREAPGASGDGVVHRRLGGAVAPAHLVRVLIEAVLRVVDDDVGAGEELDVTAILTVHGLSRSRPGRGRDGSDEPGCVGLVIDRVDQRDRAHLESIAQGQRGMIQVLGDHTHAADGEAALGEVVVADRGPELPERDGEIRVLHLPRQRPFQLVPQVTRGIDVPFVVGVEQGREEGKALDVVPVRVGDHQVPTHGAPVRGQRQPESVGAGAAVEDDQGAVRRAHLDARRVAPVTERGRTRHRQ